MGGQGGQSDPPSSKFFKFYVFFLRFLIKLTPLKHNFEIYRSVCLEKLQNIYIFGRAFGAKQEKTFKFSVRGPGRGKNQVLTRGYHREKWKFFVEHILYGKIFWGVFFGPKFQQD